MHERTKKFWILFIFLVLGPILTLLLITTLIYRRTGGTVRNQEEQLAIFMKRPVSIGQIKFKTPGQTDYFDVRLKSKDKRESIFFCPELYTFQKSSTPTQQELLELFPDQKRFKQDQIVTKPTPPITQSDENILADLESYNRSFLDNVPENISKVSIWKIPRLYVRYSRLDEFRDWFFTWIQRQETEPDRLVFFKIEEIQIMYSDADFNEMTRHSDLKGPNEVNKTTDDWLKRGIDTSFEATQGWISQFNSQLTAAVLSGVNGMFLDQRGHRQLDFSFHFAGIPCIYPINCSIEFQDKNLQDTNSEAKTRLILNTNKGSFPASLISCFSTFFYLADQKSWFTGLAIGNFTLAQKDLPAKTIWYLGNIHFYNSELTPFANRFTPTRVTGTIIDLKLDRAMIKDGVFSAIGSIYLNKGTVDKSFFIKLQDQFHLRFEPGNTLLNRFENDAVPYDEFFFEFRMLPQGIEINSSYPDRVIACFQQKTSQPENTFLYRLYLPDNANDRMVYYPNLLKLFTTKEGTTPYWSQHYKDAINHLPVENIPLETNDNTTNGGLIPPF